MAGLYIHIPFCRSRCVYCAFYSTTGMEQRQRYVDAVCREMDMRLLPHPAADDIETVYLGGGTPSQLTAGQLRQLFDHLATRTAASVPQEVTIEVNPDDVTAELAELLAELPVNRVSMGAQTFDDNRLRFLRRRHNAAQVAQAVGRLRRAGIGNISVDVMYGFPGESLDDWMRDVEAAIALDVEHLSAYCLTVEEGTALHGLVQARKVTLPDEELERQMYYNLIERLTTAGYEHYEISNFARRGFRSRHNSSYWSDTTYIGLGAAAHSYDGATRRWNAADIRQYMDAIEQGRQPCEVETIDDDTHYNDRITTALRTSDGLDLGTLSERHRRYCLKESRRLLDDGLLRQDGQRLILTRKGLFVSDYVMASLIFV